MKSSTFLSRFTVIFGGGTETKLEPGLAMASGVLWACPTPIGIQYQYTEALLC